MTSTLEFSSYLFDGRDELCLLAGAAHDRRILLIPPLFDEMNRMRRVLADVMRLLDENGIGSALPDLPGTNESLFPLEQADLPLWRKAVAACAEQHNCGRFVAAFRGGCLIDNYGPGISHWRLAPLRGKSQLRTMMRTRVASDKEAGIKTTLAELVEAAKSETIRLAGNDLGSAMTESLQQACPFKPEDLRTVDVGADNGSGYDRIKGSALWLRAEPDTDPVLSQSIADDLLCWLRR